MLISIKYLLIVNITLWRVIIVYFILQAQMGLLVILLVAILDFFLGAIIGPRSDDTKAKGFVGFNGIHFF